MLAGLTSYEKIKAQKFDLNTFWTNYDIGKQGSGLWNYF